jgi:3-isopropylmalate/(R)-2-methylmalate dehydratase small subunit
MQPFDRLEGVAAPLPLANVDTDQIIPARFLKTVERQGLGKGLFAAMRFEPEGPEKPDFVLNQPAYRQAKVLLAGDNFGCGSSREHAPWALMDFGIRCVIAPSFADIFANNCLNNGLLLITLPQAEVDALMDEARGGNHVFAVDLPAQTVIAPSGATHGFSIDPNAKDKLLKGLDAVGETLVHVAEIDAYERRRRVEEPWDA